MSAITLTNRVHQLGLRLEWNDFQSIHEDHKTRWTTRVYINDILYGEGRAFQKQHARDIAAGTALAHLPDN
ncbi:hypothetical protein BS47DRAFT_1344124, partial [Hydnum rufescens UP504]